MKANLKIKNVLLRPLMLRKDARLQRLILAALLFIIIYLFMAIASMPARVNVELGKPYTGKEVLAKRDVIDEYTTEQLRRAAVEAVPDVYDHNTFILEQAMESISLFFNTAGELSQDDTLTVEEKNRRLQDMLEEELPEATLRAFWETDVPTLEDLENRLSETVRQVMEQGIKINGVDTARRHIYQEIALFPFGADLKRVAEKLIDPLLEPNMILNEEATALHREMARQSVAPVLLLRGTRIIGKGDIVTEKHIAQLESLGLIRGSQADYPGFLGLFFLLLLLFAAVGIYLFIFVNNVYNNLSLILLLGLVVIITMILAVAAFNFQGYLIPVAMGVMLIAIMFDARLALLMNIIFALLVGLVTGGEFTYIAAALMGGLVGIYGVSRVSQRGDLAKAGVYVAAANAAVIVTFFLVQGNLNLETDNLMNLGYSLLAGVGNGLGSAILAIGLLPYLESGFGLTTAITLLELSNPNNPLLRMLLNKAPGTYYHSIMVGNLAEAAAEAVQADSLLTRVGAYYHDIGKLKRPYFFSENQLSGENPHQKISPNLSALIIGSHVKDGVELGRRYRLPGILQDIIGQHHGTSLISFFYHQALENENREHVSMDNFRYDGPLPQTKEAAIIMLADAVEAGARSLSNPQSNRMEGLIRRIIKDKLSDGQLDECNLTLKELDRIGDSFVNIMSGIYHSRIEYPEKDLRAELERGNGK